jgi:ribose transport system ATP-binding protein
MQAASLEIAELSKSYPGVGALDGVSLQCRPGETHAIVGENGSGKSTLGIASGAVIPDSGAVTIMGRPLTTADPLLARRLGLATVYQDDSLVRELTWPRTSIPAPRSAVAIGGRNEWAERLLRSYDLDIAPDAMVAALSPSQRQFLEIVKALATEPKVLLLDEPTSTLDLPGVEKLSSIIRRITAQGTGVVYVSHRLPEVLALADRVTILRDGKGQGTYEVTPALSEADLIALMVGRPIDTEYPAKRQADIESAGVLFWAAGLSGARFHNINLHVHRGEILGFAGSESNGQRETLRALGGSRRRERLSALRGGGGEGERSTRASDAGIPVAQRRPSAGVDLRSPRRARKHDRSGAGEVRRPPASSRRRRSALRPRRWWRSSASPRRGSTSRSAACPAAISRRRCWRGASCMTPKWC